MTVDSGTECRLYWVRVKERSRYRLVELGVLAFGQLIEDILMKFKERRQLTCRFGGAEW